jgi:hypothetical protein
MRVSAGNSVNEAFIFTLTIAPCEITGIVATDLADVVYYVSAAPKTIMIPIFTTIPSCDVTIASKVI